MHSRRRAGAAITEKSAGHHMAALPETCIGPLVSHRDALLIWVRSGNAEIRMERRSHRLTDSQAIWVPAAIPVSIVVGEGSVAIPIPVSSVDLPATFSTVRVVAIPPGWADRLLLEFARTFGCRKRSAESVSFVLELIAGSPGNGDDPILDVPPLPRSPEALEVAHELLRAPAAPQTIGEFARRAQVSVRTLQRQFTGETGLGFDGWRTRARILAAMSHLAARRGIGWTASQVGFGTPSAFTNAFRRLTGTTPSRYVRDLESPAARQNPPVAAPAGSPALSTAPPLEPSATWTRVDEFHVLVWAYRGSARVDVSSHEWALNRGDVMLLPAGLPNRVEADAGSIVLPVCSLSLHAAAHLDSVAVVRLDEADDSLLRAAVGNHPIGRAQKERADPAGRAVHEVLVSRIGLTDEPGPYTVITRILAALYAEPADDRTLAEWAAAMRIEPSRLRKEFFAQTGTSFSRWRLTLRMTIARELLDAGSAPSAVARHLGYADAAAFSRAFRTTHGCPPRDYQRRPVQDGGADQVVWC